MEAIKACDDCPRIIIDGEVLLDLHTRSTHIWTVGTTHPDTECTSNGLYYRLSRRIARPWPHPQLFRAQAVGSVGG
jgi:hypothetical protein